jgi:hypothetical protein
LLHLTLLLLDQFVQVHFDLHTTGWRLRN